MPAPAVRDRWITVAFVIAAANNILFVLAEWLVLGGGVGRVWPEVFGNFGMISIMLWGIAYLATAPGWRHVPLVCIVFALEKAVYVGTWLYWHTRLAGPWLEASGPLPPDALVVFVYRVYGLIDLAFGLLFAWAAWRAWHTKPLKR